MQLKKKTGILMVTTAAAAVVGISAVSFAAWTGNTSSTLSANAATGTIYTFGFNNTDELSLTGADSTNKLVPYDQSEATVKTGNYVVSVQLPDYTVYGEGYNITVKLHEAIDEKYELYVQYTENAYEVTDDTPIVLSEWDKITTDGVVIVDEPSNTEANENVAGLWVNVILKSEGAAPTEEVTFALDVVLTTASHTV